MVSHPRINLGQSCLVSESGKFIVFRLLDHGTTAAYFITEPHPALLVLDKQELSKYLGMYDILL